MQKIVADAQKRVQEKKQAKASNALPASVTLTQAVDSETSATGWASLKKEQKDQIFGCGCVSILGLIVLVVVVPMLSGSSPSTERKTFKSERDIRSLILGKTEQDVIQVLGKPDWVYAAQGRFTNGSTYDERWEYSRLIEHKATGKFLEFAVLFRKGVVIETEVKGGL